MVFFPVIIMLKHLSQFGTLVKSITKMNPPHFTTIPNLRGPAVVSANQSSEIVLDNLRKNIEDKLPWNLLVCKDGNTQKKERIYIPVIREVINDLGGYIGHEAGSQEAMDFRDVKLPDLDFMFDCDGKSNDKGFKFMFNDSVPKVDGYYIFIQVEHKKVIIKSGLNIIKCIVDENEMTCEEVIKELDERSRIILANKNFKIGGSNAFIDSYARPSWGVKLPREWFGVTPKKKKEEIVKEIGEFFPGKWPRKNSDEAKKYEHFCGKNDSISQLTIFLESLTQQSSESEVEEQRSPTEQPDPSKTPPLYSPSGTPVSV